MTTPMIYFMHFLNCTVMYASYRRDGCPEQAERWHKAAVDTYGQMTPVDQERARAEYERLTGQEWKSNESRTE